MVTQKVLSWLVALAGLWEVIAVFVLGYSASTTALWDALIVGVALIVLGGWAALSSQEGTDKTLDWINAILGVWLIIAPFVLGYTALVAALWNDIIVGIVVVVIAGWAALAMGRHHPITT
jgi:SPW repeat